MGYARLVLSSEAPHADRIRNRPKSESMINIIHQRASFRASRTQKIGVVGRASLNTNDRDRSLVARVVFIDLGSGPGPGWARGVVTHIRDRLAGHASPCSRAQVAPSRQRCGGFGCEVPHSSQLRCSTFRLRTHNQHPGCQIDEVLSLVSSLIRRTLPRQGCFASASITSTAWPSATAPACFRTRS
jgi:hypothetical protein